MRLLKQPDEPVCLIYASAMMLGMEPEEIFDILGRRVGLYNYHLQEIVDIALTRGIALVPYQAVPWSILSLKNIDEFKLLMPAEQAIDMFIKRIAGRRALLCNAAHICAWDGNQVFDPHGRIYEIDNFIARVEDKRHIEAWISYQIIS
jgi:hypothetical protein